MHNISLENISEPAIAPILEKNDVQEATSNESYIEEANRSTNKLISGQLTETFVNNIKTGKYAQVFTYSKKKIQHDSAKVRFFTKKKKLNGIPFPTSESCHIRCNTYEELQELKSDLLNKPFMLKAKMWVIVSKCLGYEERCNKSAVFSINPKHPEIASQLKNAFEKAEELIENDTPYSIRINFGKSVIEWFTNYVENNLVGPTTKVGIAFADITISNGSPGVTWCGECSYPRVFCMGLFFCLWVACCCGEKTYRKCKYHSHDDIITCQIIDAQ